MPASELLPLSVSLLIGIPALGSCIGIGLWFATANPFR
jgi:hypothetical protein